MEKDLIEGPTPVVFVHGTRMSGDVWRAQVDAMKRYGHDSAAPDLAGHGTRSSERFTLDEAMKTIDEAVESFAVPPLLVGNSLGGYLAFMYAARQQEKLAGVVASACSTDFSRMPLGPYRDVSSWLDRKFGPADSTWSVVADMLSALEGYSSLDDLRRLTLLVWLINGQRDILRFGERSYLAAKPGTKLTVVPNARHDVNIDAPAAYNRVLIGALHNLQTINLRENH